MSNDRWTIYRLGYRLLFYKMHILLLIFLLCVALNTLQEFLPPSQYRFIFLDPELISFVSVFPIIEGIIPQYPVTISWVSLEAFFPLVSSLRLFYLYRLRFSVSRVLTIESFAILWIWWLVQFPILLVVLC